jgi:hypothetical protein
MDDDILAGVAEDWQIVLRVLPVGWQDKARELGALRRCRQFADAATLLRVLLIHLAEGCSLRETAVRAAEGQLVTVSDVERRMVSLDGRGIDASLGDAAVGPATVGYRPAGSHR